MVYEEEAGGLNLVAVGDTMITQRLSVYREERYLALVELIRSADAAFANLEMTFHDYEVAPGLSTSPAYSATDPSRLEEYKWLGFDLVTMAHNHHNDYGIDGLLASQRHVEGAGLVHAGAGNNLAEARAPGYLETPKGRIALLACVSTFVEAGAATHQRPDHRGRAGISPLRHEWIYTVDGDAFNQLRRISEKLGLEDMKGFLRRFASFGEVAEDTETEFRFMERGSPRHTSLFWAIPVDDFNSVEIDMSPVPDGQTNQRARTRSLALQYNRGGRDYEQMQRFPGDYEAQVGQRAIVVHALEHLGVEDRGVTMMRKGLRQRVRTVQQGQDPPELKHLSGKTVTTYGGDTLLKVVQAATPEEDRDLVRRTGLELAERYIQCPPNLAGPVQ